MSMTNKYKYPSVWTRSCVDMARFQFKIEYEMCGVFFYTFMNDKSKPQMYENT